MSIMISSNLGSSENCIEKQLRNNENFEIDKDPKINANEDDQKTYESCKKIKISSNDDGTNNLTTTSNSLNSNIDDVDIDKNNLITKSSENELDKVVQQIEYYFSEQNIKYDSFFQEKLKEAHEIKGQDEGFMDIKWIFSAPRIQKFLVTNSKDQIIDCIKKNSSQIKIYDVEAGDVKVTYIGRSMVIPSLEVRPVRENNRFKRTHTNHVKSIVGKKNLLDNHHVGGCLIKIENIPEEISSWQTVKDSLKSILPENAKDSIKFSSKVDKNGTCKMWVKPFENDIKFFSDECKFDLNGNAVSVTLMADETEIKKFIDEDFMQRTRKERIKEIRNLKCKGRTKSIFLADQKFNNTEHLRKCVKELLDKSEVGKFFGVDTNTAQILYSLLSYHPKRDKICQKDDFIGIKVGYYADDKSTKCFFIVKKIDGVEVEEDFSIIKCIKGLQDRLSRDTDDLDNV